MRPDDGPPATIDLVRELKADLGMIVRRSFADSLTEDEFRQVATRMRSRLNALEYELGEAGPVSLHDLGSTLGAMIDAGRLRRASDLLPNRTRTYGHLAVIDGDRAPPIQSQTKQGN